MTVLKETPQKVLITGRYGSPNRWYDWKTAVSEGYAYQWIRRDRNEVKRLMIAELERREAEAQGALSHARSLLGRAHAS